MLLVKTFRIGTKGKTKLEKELLKKEAEMEDKLNERAMRIAELEVERTVTIFTWAVLIIGSFGYNLVVPVGAIICLPFIFGGLLRVLSAIFSALPAPGMK
jgi:hypothetical protein